MSNIKIVRLKSGEEILCDLGVSGDKYVLKLPAVIIPTGDGNIGFAHWLPYARNEAVQISTKYVVFIVDPTTQLANEYIKMHSNIIVPEQANKDIIVPS